MELIDKRPEPWVSTAVLTVKLLPSCTIVQEVRVHEIGCSIFLAIIRTGSPMTVLLTGEHTAAGESSLETRTIMSIVSTATTDTGFGQ